MRETKKICKSCLHSCGEDLDGSLKDCDAASNDFFDIKNGKKNKCERYKKDTYGDELTSVKTQIECINEETTNIRLSINKINDILDDLGCLPQGISETVNEFEKVYSKLLGQLDVVKVRCF